MKASLRSLMLVCVVFGGFGGLGGLLAPPQAMAAPLTDESVPWAHGISMHGDPALPASFTHLPYANPEAKKGGRITYGVQGSFDSLNQFIVQGGTSSARGISEVEFGPLVQETLLTRNYDEAFGLYGLLAEDVRMPESREWIEFRINPNARFSDASPVTVEDVIFSFEILRDKGRPHFRSRYNRIKSMEKTGERSVKFTFENGDDRELPLLLGLSPIFSKKDIDVATFDKSTLTPMLGSGPYVLSDVNPGVSTVFSRNPDYWGRDLPINAGRFNYDEIRVEYYRDENALQESFKKGLVSVLPIRDAKRWSSDFNFPAVVEKRVILDSFPLETPAEITGFVFNTRKPVFEDIQIRKALAMLIDFDWLNRNLFYGLYKRTNGYFDNSILSSIGRPADVREQSLLAPFPDSVDPQVMAGTWKAHSVSSSNGGRETLREAMSLLKAAGYSAKDGAMRNETTGEPLEFEIMTATPDQERLAIVYQRQLSRIGVNANIRSVDAAQYQRRRQTFDYDMMLNTLSSSLSPGNEQRYRFDGTSATLEGTFNYAGVENAAVDAMIDALLSARTQEEFISAVRAYDRALISGHYIVPLFHRPENWVARWANVKHPAKTSLSGEKLDTWWLEENE